ncbi:MAG: DUF1553 domain-containing protein, partial [Verrucomicrobiales bacterium]|nr:DUF1553 domain-containing protein [Verrucomicrobiales bacterium]
LDTEAGAKADLGDGFAAFVAKDLEKSEAIYRIFQDDRTEVMPPPDAVKQLSDAEKSTLRKWVEQGAEWAEHWSFVPPKKADTEGTPVDYFVERKLKENDLDFSPEAKKETLIRRVTLDLTGLPPTVVEVDAFLADDSPGAYEKVVDRLLKSPRYAERMTWQWLEAARYADTDGYQNDGPRDMWRWRDWVIAAYAKNMPFDQFTIEQLAGDLLENPTEEQLIATGFNRNHRYNSEAGLVLEEFLLENAVDRVDTTSTVWMGVTMSCARCHDHKYDPFSQREYYQLISFFDAVPESGRAIKFGNSEPWMKAPTAEQNAKLAEFDTKIEEAKAAFAKFETQIEDHLASQGSPGPPPYPPIITRGLDHHFTKDSEDPIVADGEKPVVISKKKIPGLICNGRFSIAFKMKPEQIESGAVLSNETGDTTRKGIFVAFRDSHLRFSINSRWIAGVAMLETIRKFEPGETVHITLTNDGTQRAQGMQIFVDGVPVEVRELYNTNSNASGRETGGPINVGGSKHLGNWKGEVSDLRFYTSRTLEQNEVRLLASGYDSRQFLLESNGFGKAVSDAWRRIENLKEQRQKFHDSLPTTMIMVEGLKPEPTRLRVRGEYHNKGDVVESSVPAILPSISENPNRLDFAKWLVSGEHPLTARVVVNRYWQMLFGRGLVKTAEDFGAQGELPSHPELLDWLSVEFVESGWDVRHILKTIVTSRTYRQASEIRSEHLEKDPENALLARAPRLRLGGNILRDQALFLGGLLVEKQGGPSVKPYQPARLWREASNFSYNVGKGDDLYRRSLYTYWKRTLAPPSMALLDTADREWCSVKPKRTNTPLQALTLMNETGFFESARKFAERILAEEPDARAEFAFRAVTSRSPTADELAILKSAWDGYAAEFSGPAAAKKSLSVGDSKPDPKFDPVELATAAALANMLLNLDEATVRE